MIDDQTAVLQGLIDRMRSGDEVARRELIDRAYVRLRALSATILRKSFPRMRQAPGFVETTDVANESAYRLYHALADIQPATVRDFFRLAAQRIRWLLLDLARRAARPTEGTIEDWLEGPGPADSGRPAPPAVLEELYRQIEALPEHEREVVDLLYFHGLSQAEAAAQLGVTERTVRRHWAVARVRLFDALKGTLPEAGKLVAME